MMKNYIKGIILTVFSLVISLSLFSMINLIDTVHAQEIGTFNCKNHNDHNETAQTNELGIESFVGYGCGNAKIEENHSKPVINYDIEGYIGLGCNESGCGPGREAGYSSDYLNKGCRNWQRMPIYSPVYKYWIDESSLSGLSETEKLQFINNVDSAANKWNSTRIHDYSGPIVAFTKETSSGLGICPVRYDPTLSNRGKFNPVFYEIRLKSYDVNTAAHEFGHMLGLQDLDMNRDHVHTVLMGYNKQPYGDQLQYQDIQGIAVVNKAHTVHDFKRYTIDEGKYKHFCFYCDLMNTQKSPISGSAAFKEAAGCIHEYKQMVSAGDRHWLKCTKCYKVVESEFLIQGITNTTVKIVKPLNVNKASQNIPSSIEGQSVTVIDDCAFSNQTGITSIKLPNTITTIGDSAFSGCSNLTVINFQFGLTSIGESAFNRCTKLEIITLPNSVTSIGGSAFRDCTSLKKINIPKNVTSIGKGAFSGCRSLHTVNWDATNFIKSNKFDSIFEGSMSLITVNIGNNVKTIPDYTFYNCSNIKSIYISDSVTTIGDEVFSNCSRLTHIEIRASVVNIGEYVFFGCTGLKSAIINNKIIGNGEFNGCSNLTDVTLGSDLTSIGDYAFYSCDSLESITIPEKVENIGIYVFNFCRNLKLIDFRADNCNNFTANDNPFEEIGSKSLTINFNCDKVPDYILYNINNVEEVYFGEEVKIIGRYAFQRCGMKRIYISEGVDYIDNFIFYKCNNLVEIEVSPDNPTYLSENNCIIRKSDSTLIVACNTSRIPNCVKNIAENAFVELNITSLTIPNTVTHIEDNAINNCIRLQSISLPIEGEGSPAWQSFNLLFSGGMGPKWYMEVNITNGSTIHENAFIGSNRVTKIILPNTVEVLSDNVFAYCSMLREINLPESLREINGAFVGCSFLGGLRIPSSVMFIAENAFVGCDRLQFIVLQRTAAQGITVIEKGIFGELNVNSKLKGIIVNDRDSYDMYVNQFLANGEPELADLVAFKELYFTLLDDYSYSVKRGRKLLQGTIEIPAYHNGIPVTVIEQDAFKGCELMTSIMIPETVTVIKSGAFDDCGNLRTLQIQRHISSEIVDLSADIFGETHIWGNIILQDEATYLAYVNAYPKYEDLFVYYEGNLNYELKSDGTYKVTGRAVVNEAESNVIFIPSYYNGKPVTEIGNEAFMDCSFRSVIFMGGSEIQTIGNKAFYNCTELYCIEIPIGVLYIGDQAFAGTDLKSITLRSFIEVGTSAFASSVTVYTDAAVVPENWSFVDGHYIFFNCELSEAANYVESIRVQRRNGYEGTLYEPYRQWHFGVAWGSNPLMPYLITHYNELVSYSFDEIIDGALSYGTKIYAIMAYPGTI